MEENKNGYGKMYYDDTTGVIFLSDVKVKQINDALNLNCPTHDIFEQMMKERKTFTLDGGSSNE